MTIPPKTDEPCRFRIIRRLDAYGGDPCIVRKKLKPYEIRIYRLFIGRHDSCSFSQVFETASNVCSPYINFILINNFCQYFISSFYQFIIIGVINNYWFFIFHQCRYIIYAVIFVQIIPCKAFSKIFGPCFASV